jgi:uncharacterized protein
VSSLRINISKLSDGSHQYSLSAEPAEIGLDERFDRKVMVEAEVERANRQMVLRAESHSGGVFTCDRCLDEFPREVHSEFSILYVQGGDPPEGHEEDHEVQYLPADVNIIDLGEDVRQFLILSLPLKMLCRENCAGLCPVCGANRNKTRCSCTVDETDPRWATLKRFLEN